MLLRHLSLYFSLAALAWPALAASRQESLEVLLKNLPHSSTRITGRINAVDKSWEDWQKRTGELPPDFDSMPSVAALPDPLGGVRTRADWDARRPWIRQQFERWVFGRMPPKPDNLRAVITGERQEGGATVRDVRLQFGPGVTLRVQLIVPPGPGPFPVFLTNHPRTRPWVATALRRGYMACIYYAADPIYGNSDDSEAFIEAYPQYDFSCLARWAWAGMRAVDYLYTLPEVDKQKIAIAGHSRNGKQALLAAAFDERIGAVAASSGNTGECDPWRYTSDIFANESIEQITGSFPHWFHPRLRFFAGREHKLPVDQNMLMAMVAPRGLLMYSAYSESEGNGFGFEQAYRSVKQVYRFLDQPEHAGLYLRAGEHPTTAGDIENFMDFFDGVFGRKSFAAPERWIRGYTWERWRALSGENLPPNPGNASVAAKIRWALGEEPPYVSFPNARKLPKSAMTSDGWLGVLFRRPVQSAGAGYAPLPFGDDLKADFYYPEGTPGKWPVVIWLHPYSYSTGYSRNARNMVAALVKRGFAVAAFDQIGFGARVEHAREFYKRYPHWSLLGKMVSDTRALVDAVSALEQVDPSRVYLAGWALGAKVALFTAALDRRVAAAASVAGFTPLRTDTAEKGTEGLRHYSHLHGMVPRFGFYIGKEAELPLDYDDLLAAIAPRPVYVLAPTLDRYATAADVQRVARAARNVTLDAAVDFNRFPPAAQERVWDWLAGLRQ